MARVTGAGMGIVDDKQLGRLVRAARTIAGFSRADDAAKALSERGGKAVTERMLTALERGEVRMTLEMAVLLVAVFQPPGGLSWFQPAFTLPLAA